MPHPLRAALAIAVNLLIAYAAYTVCRVEFLLENWAEYSLTLTWKGVWTMLRGGVWFDTSAICYTNILYVVLAMLPVALPRRRAWSLAVKLSWMVPNALAIVLALGDSVYYPYGHHRISMRTFNEFGAEDNLGRIIGIEAVNHWYLVLLAALMLWGMWRLYRPQGMCFTRPGRWWKWTLWAVALGCTVVAAIWGMRGATFFTSTRPIAVSNAHQFASRPSEANVVLNTPFSLIRTIGKRPPRVPDWFTPQQLDGIYSPVHRPDSAAAVRRKNVVVLIVESFATEFIGSLGGNRALDDSTYRGYTPWIDSLVARSLTFETTVANTGVSIDAMPAILASIPRMNNMFFTSPYSLNHVTSFATELGGNWGYKTAFFHGGTNDSMGFQAFARGAGFEDYYGLDEYCRDPRTGGMADWDGTWAIWDEEFLQYYALKMSEMPQPFVTGVFTASSHHPFAIPAKYKDRFTDEGLFPLHKCIRYTDYSLGRFFETASRQPWYANTIFVLTADHSSSKRTHDEYKTDLGDNRVPILIFDPSGEMPRGARPGIMQHIDILPTVLGWLGYDREYIAFGEDALKADPSRTWAFNWIFAPNLYSGRWYLLTDPEGNARGLYDFKADRLQRHNLLDSLPRVAAGMQDTVRAIIQSYLERMEADSVRIR